MWRRRREQDLERELRAHIDLESEEGGDAAARRALGNVGLIKEDVRRAWGWSSLGDFARHLRQSIRSLARRPAFASVAVLSLAAGIGANTAVFSLARGIVFKTLPAPGADRMLLIRQHNLSFHLDNCCFGYAFFQELRKTDPDFDGMLAVKPQEIELSESGENEKVNAEIVSGNYFRVLDVRPVLGRLLDESEEASGRVCVISYDLWQERFGGRSDVIGQQVMLGTEAFQIAGVTQRGFHGAALHSHADLQMPAWMADKLMGGRGSGWAMILARLKPGVRPEQAEARLNALGKEVQRSTGTRMGEKDDFFLLDGSQGIGSKKEQYGKPVLMLFLLVAVVLLVACCNLAALLLVRSVERSREAGMRLAIGASRGALVRQFLLESLLLAAVGGAAGWALARAMNRILLSLLDTASAGLAQEAQLDGNVFAFCAGLTLMAGLLFGALPAWRASRVDPLTAIRGAATGGARSILASALIAAQISLSLALLFGAGLFTQTLRHLHAIDLGFDPENLLSVQVEHHNNPQTASAFYQELLQRVRSMDGVRAASLGRTPLAPNFGAVTVHIPGYALPAGHAYATANITAVSDGYFRTLGAPLLAGRDFNSDDRDDSPEVPVIVNREFAREFFGGDAVGHTFTYGAGVKARVIGVTETTKYRSLREDPSPAMYRPMAPHYSSTLQVRIAGDSAAAIERVRSLVRSIDSSASLDTVATMEMQIDEGLARERMLAFLSTLLGGISVALAAIGLYGVLAFSVSRRTREIGIRMAVGADRAGIVGMVLRESVWIVAAGVAAGIPLAFGCGRFASALLYGLNAQDARTAVVATLLLAAAALIASLLPAWRAARVDPMTALRSE